MRQLLHVTIIVFCVTSIQSFAQSCDSAIETHTVTKHVHQMLRVKNISKQPILAYTIVVQPVKDVDTHRQILSGMFTDGSSWKSNESMKFDLPADISSSFNISVDYVRRADGWSCGNKLSAEAQQLERRFNE